MSGAAFDITLADGRKLQNVRVQGSGGEIGAGVFALLRKVDGERLHECLRNQLLRLRGIVRLASKGEKLPIYEPFPGHVKVYHGIWQPSDADERTEVVDIRGASIELSPLLVEAWEAREAASMLQRASEC